jgi:hypothetical protein
MTARMLLAGTVGVVEIALWLSTAVAGDVKIGVNIGIPAPPVPVVVAPAPPVVVAPPGPQVVVAPPSLVFAAPPTLVLVPGSPVYYVPSANFNVFVFGGRYYSLHDGTWFMAPNHSGPWAMVPAGRVPNPVLAVPHAYYEVPPGHAKKIGAPEVPPGHAKGPRGGKKGRDD